MQMTLNPAGVLFLLGALGVTSWFLLRLLLELTARDIQRELDKYHTHYTGGTLPNEKD